MFALAYYRTRISDFFKDTDRAISSTWYFTKVHELNRASKAACETLEASLHQLEKRPFLPDTISEAEGAIGAIFSAATKNFGFYAVRQKDGKPLGVDIKGIQQRLKFFCSLNEELCKDYQRDAYASYLIEKSRDFVKAIHHTVNDIRILALLENSLEKTSLGQDSRAHRTHSGARLILDQTRDALIVAANGIEALNKSKFTVQARYG